jgi:hypothetical protein
MTNGYCSDKETSVTGANRNVTVTRSTPTRVLHFISISTDELFLHLCANGIF